MQKLQPSTGRSLSPKSSAKTNLQRAMDDRLSQAEATATVAKLLSLFPNASGTHDGFIGAASDVLRAYPKSVAVKICEPLGGLASETEFISLSKIIAWLEKRTAPMSRDLDREVRVKAQLEARDEGNEKSERLSASCRAWLDRTDPQARELTGQQDEGRQREDARQKLLKQIGKAAFDAIPDVTTKYFESPL
jgi:hypothetical protein